VPSADPRFRTGSPSGWYHVKYWSLLFYSRRAVSSLNLSHHGKLLECRPSYHNPGFQARCNIIKNDSVRDRPVRPRLSKSHLIEITESLQFNRPSRVFKLGRILTYPTDTLRYSCLQFTGRFPLAKSRKNYIDLTYFFSVSAPRWVIPNTYCISGSMRLTHSFPSRMASLPR